ncbi:hypothetical protein ANN_19101 [Periplaneta americana]|uniref:HAT C-terminal dimerisation domain-containing protein n=1 Tax=Periplaneta americana TaxID=6978 RepID=A0ABQ8S8Y5_PERAM|nr:hypothetical protein ANN_19101 [Periplaneta americana]
MSRFGDIDWPPRSPDLTAADYFIWGYLKSRVYRNEPCTIIQRKQNIKNELSATESVLLGRVMQKFHSRLQECIRCREGYFEINSQDPFCELTKLLNILVTTAITTAEPERCFSCIKRIETFLRNTLSQDRLTALATLSIEKSMMSKMKGLTPGRVRFDLATDGGSARSAGAEVARASASCGMCCALGRRVEWGESDSGRAERYPDDSRMDTSGNL